MSQGSTILPTTGTISGLTEQNDINAALAALLSNNSGASAPSSPAQYQFWYNTTTGWLQQYDGANWVNVLNIDTTNHLARMQVGGGVQASIASASTTDLWSSPGASIDVTGTVSITQLASASATPGTLKVITFAGILTLTHDATKLILPNGGANITTAAGDWMLVLALTSTNVAVINYMRANGTSLSSSAVFSSAVTFTGVISPSALASNTNNWAPSGLSGATRIRASASALINLSGLTGGSDGRIIFLDNIGSDAITLTHQDANSSAANRFTLPNGQSVIVDPGESVPLIYDGTTSFWRVYVSSSGAKLLNVLTASNSAALADTTSLTGPFSSYDLVFENIVPASTSNTAELTVNSGGLQTSGYLTCAFGYSSAGSAVTAVAPTTYIPLSLSTAFADNLQGTLRIYNPSQTAKAKLVSGLISYVTSTVDHFLTVFGRWGGGTGAVTGFSFAMGAGNISSGRILVFGNP